MAAGSVHGEILSKEKADKDYGSVLHSVKFTASELKAIIAKTQKNIMFRFEEERLYIFDYKRQLIFSNSENPGFGPEVVLKIYSLSVLEQLLANAQNEAAGDDELIVEVEKRKEVVSVSTPIETMEVSSNCPPICD